MLERLEERLRTTRLFSASKNASLLTHSRLTEDRGKERIGHAIPAVGPNGLNRVSGDAAPDIVPEIRPNVADRSAPVRGSRGNCHGVPKGVPPVQRLNHKRIH